MTRRLLHPGLWPNALAAILLATAMLLAAAGPALAQRDPGVIVGLVTALPGRAPLAGAVIEIVTTGQRASTDSAGLFHLTAVPAGDVRVDLRAIGYEPVAFLVSVQSRRTSRIEVAFEPLATLPTVQVEGMGLRLGDERLRGFHERRASGFGRFITREDIEKRNATESRELLRGLPGVRLVGTRVQMAASMSSRCTVEYFVDAIHIVAPGADFLSQFRPRDLEGIEVYRGPAETPPAFSRGGAGCGVIVLWTRSPGGNR